MNLLLLFGCLNTISVTNFKMDSMTYSIMTKYYDFSRGRPGKALHFYSYSKE